MTELDCSCYLYNKLNQDLNTDPNYNYVILSAELQAAKNLHIPRKIRKFNRRKHKKEKWMTNDRLLQIVKKNKKYVKWKSTPITHDNYEQIKQNFKIYEKDTVNIGLYISCLPHVSKQSDNC